MIGTVSFVSAHGCGTDHGAGSQRMMVIGDPVSGAMP
jgi:hypothetical protein